MTLNSEISEILQALQGGKVAFEDGATRGVVAERFDLVPVEAEVALANRLALGMGKHGEGNWQGGGVDFIKTCFNHLRRHEAWFRLGLEPDDDHLGAILANAAFLVWFRENKPDLLLQALVELRRGKLAMQREKEKENNSK